MTVDEWVKENKYAPDKFFECEASGLRWLAVENGPSVATPFEYSDTYLKMQRISSSLPKSVNAYDFGKKLAVLHSVKEDFWGIVPPVASDLKIRNTKSETKNRFTEKDSAENDKSDFKENDVYFFGPMSDPLPIKSHKYTNWHDYYKNGRIIPLIQEAKKRGRVDKYDLDITNEYLENIEEIFPIKDNVSPVRVHGDLWAGNLLWTSFEAILIDPSAHSGHYEEDLSMLNLFGLSYYEEILEGYNEVKPLSKNFMHNRQVHNVFPILGHVVFFGGGYLMQYRSMLKNLLDN